MSSGSDKRQRQEALRIRLTATERATLLSAADSAGLSLAGYARSLLLSAPPLRQARKPPASRAELARLLGELGRIGSNVNQLAHAANGGEPVNDADMRAAAKELATMREAILSALGRVP